MKVRITVIDHDGATFGGSVELARTSDSKKSSKSTPKAHTTTEPATTLSFSLNVMAFMNKYSRNMSGSRKFTLLLAHLAEGKAGQEVSGERVASTWNRMKGVLGGAYNTAHATRAKAEGWIDSHKRGYYSLSPSWREVTSGE